LDFSLPAEDEFYGRKNGCASDQMLIDDGNDDFLGFFFVRACPKNINHLVFRVYHEFSLSLEVFLGVYLLGMMYGFSQKYAYWGLFMIKVFTGR
jgi:hypothetical protein